MKNELLEELKQNAAFKNVPEEQLCWMIEQGEVRTFSAGENIVAKGDPVKYMIFVLEGVLSFRAERNGQYVEVAGVEKGGITGVLPYSRAKTAAGQGIAVSDLKLFLLDKIHFTEMIKTKYELSEALVHVMTNRVREFTRRDMHNEKLMALGKISAGLAHELNNPSSAVVRAASDLYKHLGTEPERFKKIISMKATGEQVDKVNDFLFSKLKQETTHLSLLERTEKEDEIFTWLDKNKVESADCIAPTFVDFGVTRDDLDEILNIVGPDYIETVSEWLDNSMVTEKLLCEIREASKRINDLVTSIKSYSQMDKSPDKQNTDVRKGIENTITMLGHKIKRKNIRIEIDMNGIPEVAAYVGELNQVWTNLLDNAIDALDSDGTIKIFAAEDNEFLEVKITDNGSGIPEEIQSQIFDPFFTTKKIGEGTGLGLDIVQRIIAHHNGKIYVKSKPGETEFRVCIPLN